MKVTLHKIIFLIRDNKFDVSESRHRSRMSDGKHNEHGKEQLRITDGRINTLIRKL
jgi:hypothetical protein